MSEIRLSVVIPVFNGAAWIAEQLDALADQTATFEWEVVVSDNGSTDETRRIVEHRIRNFPVPLRIVDASARRGVAHARNVGVCAAVGQLFAICDCDDVVATTWVQAAAEGLREYSFVCGPIQELGAGLDGEGSPMRWPVEASFGTLLPGNNFGGRKEDYLRLGGMDESLPGYGVEDAEFSIRVNEQELPIGVMASMILRFRPTPVGMRLVRKIYESGIAEVEVWRRHPVRFAHRIGVSVALRSILALPLFAMRSRSVSHVARESILRLGHLRAHSRAPSNGPSRSLSEERSDETKRALWLVPVADLGGVARHILDVTRVGIPGWHVTVLCPEGPLAERLRAQGADVVTGQFGPDAGALASRRTLSRVAKAFRPDIVHSHLAYADIINAWSLLPKGTRRFTTEHGIAGDDGLYHKSTLQSKGMALVHRARFPRFDGVIAVSQATRKAMLDKWKVRQPITVILNGADLPEGVTRREADTVSGLRILSLSRLAPEKRIDRLIDAFAFVKAEHPESTLTIGGEGPQRRELEAQAARLGLGESVRFPGFMDPEQAMAEADVLVQLSVWENCSYTILDGALRGLRLVASDAGGNREVLGRAGVLQETDSRGVAVSIVNAKNVDSRSLTSVEDMCRSFVQEMCRKQGGCNA